MYSTRKSTFSHERLRQKARFVKERLLHMSEAWQLGIPLDQAHNEWSYEKYMQKRVGKT